MTYKYRLGLFKNFYSCDKSKQGTFLQANIQIGRINRRRHGSYDDISKSRRQCTIFYTVPNEDGEHIRVCRNVFANIFASNHKEIQIIVEKKKKGETVYVDRRNKHSKPRKFTEEHKNQVRQHINSLPVEENHYSRNKFNKQFLSPDLNINRLFKAFMIQNPDSPINYRFYARHIQKRI